MVGSKFLYHVCNERTTQSGCKRPKIKKANYNKRWESIRGELAEELASEMEGAAELPMTSRTAKLEQGRARSHKRPREASESDPDMLLDLAMSANTASNSSIQQMSLAPFVSGTSQVEWFSGNTESQQAGTDPANAVDSSNWHFASAQPSTLFGGLSDSEQLCWDFFGTNY